MRLLLQKLLNGLAIGGVYAIFALGYTIVFSILRVINFAHGAIFTVGAYLTYALTGAAFGRNGQLRNASLPVELNFWLALILGALGAGVLGILVERVAFKPLRRRGSDPLLTLVSSLGVAIATVNILQYLFGAENYGFGETLGSMRPSVTLIGGDLPVVIRTKQIVIFAVSMVMVVALTLLINRTRIGKGLWAVAEDATTAGLLGIDTDRLIRLSFFLSGVLGGIAGALIGLAGSFNNQFGVAIGLKGLAVIVLGGLGDIPGAVVGGLVIGVAESFVPAEYNAYKDAVPFVVLLVVLLARPQGLLGRAQVQKV
ncbi:MAG TPA: branched-chain amino acid ABC transporter permease [Acidimicrobiia bacterium]|nr:branched-chain amino acid ABC transporter permease [Acidimicrobiia bacterium]